MSSPQDAVTLAGVVNRNRGIGGYTPYVFERVRKTCRINRLRTGRKQVCAGR
jgi:hypothetical protein